MAETSYIPRVFTFYKDEADEWRWNKASLKGMIVADSGEGYDNFKDAITQTFDDLQLGDTVVVPASEMEAATAYLRMQGLLDEVTLKEPEPED